MKKQLTFLVLLALLGAFRTSSVRLLGKVFLIAILLCCKVYGQQVDSIEYVRVSTTPKFVAYYEDGTTEYLKDKLQLQNIVFRTSDDIHAANFFKITRYFKKKGYLLISSSASNDFVEYIFLRNHKRNAVLHQK